MFKDDDIFKPKIKKLSLIKDEEKEEEKFGWLQKITKLMPREEYRFLKDYKKTAIKQGLSLNPDDPKHYYDYRGLWKETGKIEPDETGHFSSKWKLKGHPDMYVEGVKTKEEEKPGWKQRTRGIGELPKIEGKIGLGAKPEVDVSLTTLKEEDIFKPPKIKKLGLIKEKEDVLKPQIGLDIKEKGFAEKPTETQLGIDMSGFFKPEDKPEPTWGDVVKHSLKSGLGQFQASLVNLFRLIDMGVTKLTDPIQNIIPIDDEKMKAFEKKYGEKPTVNTTDMLAKIVEDSEKIAFESAEQSESKQWLKKLVGTGLKSSPQIVGSAILGMGMPIVEGLAATKPLAEIITRVTQMIPFGLSAMGGQARQIEKEYEALGKEAPYYAMVIGGALSGIGEMATELPVFMGVARMLKSGGKAFINEGAKTLLDKYGKLGIEFIKNLALQSWQEGEMVFIEKSIRQALGLPSDWSIEPLVKEFGEACYGGFAMALVMGGLGGSIIGSTKIATKTIEAVDNVIRNKGDIRVAIRKIAEIQNLIPEMSEEELALAYKLPKMSIEETKKYLVDKGIKEEFLTPEFLKKFIEKPEIQELATGKIKKTELPEFVRRQIIEPTKEELAKIEAEKPLTAKEKFMARVKEIIGVKPEVKPKVEVKPLLEEEVTVSLEEEGKVEALWEGEDIGGTSEEITEGTLKAFDKTSIFLFNKPFSELNKSELNKVLETSKQPLPDSSGEYINKIGTPTKGLELQPLDDAHARFIFGGYTKEILTDSHLLVLDKSVSKDILTDIIEKYKKARVKMVQTEEISFKEAQKIVDKEVEGYKKTFAKDFPKTEEIVTKEAIEKSTSLRIQGHQKTSDYTPTLTYFTDGKIQIAIDTNKLAFLNKYFPNAEIKATGVDKPLVFMEKGKLKAMVMPIRMEEYPFKITGEPTIKPVTKKIEKPIPKKLKDDYLKIIGKEVDLTTDHLELVEDIKHDIPISERLQTSYPDLMKKIPEAKFAEIEIKPTIKKLAKIKPTVKPTITPEEKAERGRLIKKIHTIKSVKGLTDKEYTQIKQKIKAKFGIPWITLTRINIEQLRDVSKSMERARPKRIGYEKVVTLKTEKKIQSLKDSLIEKFEMTEEVYEDTLKDLGIYKEPRYIDGKHFITEQKGKELIYRLIDESNILKITEPLRIALEKNPEVKKLADVIDRRVKSEGERTLKDPSDLNSARSYFQILETISGAPFFTLYQDLINTHLENRSDLNHLIEGFNEYRDIIKDEKELKKVEDWILAKSNLKGRPETPVNITPKEIKLAKEIESILKGYQSRARTEKFLDNLEHPEDMPEYLRYKKEMDKAKDIYESKGYDELVKYLETQKWGVIRSGYSPLQVVSAKIRGIHKAKGLSVIFGKEHIKVRKDIEYKESETNIITRVIAYKRQMDNLSVMAPKIRALITLANKNLDKFKNPDRVRSNLQLFFRELKGYDRSTGWFERGINRLYAQAMTTIIMGSPPLAFRNLGQNLGLGHDKAMLVDPRNKKLTPDDIVFLDTHVQQAIFMRTDWFMTGEKPLGFRIGKVQIGLERLTNLIKKINLYPRSDIANRLWGFWGKINQVKMAFADIDKNSTNKEISKAMGKAKFSDFSLLEQKRALEILSKDGKEEMERYIAKVYVDDVHFLYERAQRSLAEMGRYGRVFGNLMLFPRAYWEKLTKHSKKMTGKYVPIKERIRAFKVISSILIGGALVSVAYMKVTGRRKPPYDPLVLLAYQTGGLMIGTVDALNDVYVETINAIRGDRRALATLTSSVPALADHFIPFYNYMLRGYEAFLGDPLVNKNIDVYALKKLRQLIDNEYKIRGGAHSVERNALEKWQYFLSGAGVDVAIAERKKKERELEPIEIGKPKIPKLGIPTISKPGIKKLSPIKKF